MTHSKKLVYAIPGKEYLDSLGIERSNTTAQECDASLRLFTEYFNYCVDVVKVQHSLLQATDIHTTNIFPLKTEFSAFLYECRYRPSSVWTYVSSLAKLNKNLFEFLRSADEPLSILEVLYDDSLDWCAIRKISDNLIKIIDSKISCTKLGEFPQPGVPMSVRELMRGRTAFRKYILFLKQRLQRLNKKTTLTINP